MFHLLYACWLNRFCILFCQQLLCALSFFANGSYQRPVGRSVDLNLSQSPVSNSIEEVTNALNEPDILTRFIRFPATPEEREATIER